MAQQVASKTHTGSVNWFRNDLGYGFISPDDGGENIFVHFSSIQGDGYLSLIPEMRVEFETKIGAKGKTEAVNVREL